MIELTTCKTSQKEPMPIFRTFDWGERQADLQETRQSTVQIGPSLHQTAEPLVIRKCNAAKAFLHCTV